jgi:hypothetical protein
MTWHRIFLIVTGCAIVGMLMGGLFGWGAGKIAPDLFRTILAPWQASIEPVGAAVFLGATAGVLLGGGLGCFGILIQFALEWRRQGPTK